MSTTVVSPHTLTLYSHDSCTCTVPANVPTEIEERFVPDAVKKGLEFFANSTAPKAKPALTIEQAILEIIEQGDPDAFNALTGLPKVAPVSDLVGEKVSVRAIEKAWHEMDLVRTDAEPEPQESSEDS